jgi:hypothetical protein
MFHDPNTGAEKSMALNESGQGVVDMGTKIAGEDLTLDRMKVSNTGTPVNLTASAAVKTGAGRVLGVYVASTSSGTFKLWDNTAGSGTVIVNTTTPTAGQFIRIDADFSTGLYCTIGSTIDLTIIYI